MLGFSPSTGSVRLCYVAWRSKDSLTDYQVCLSVHVAVHEGILWLYQSRSLCNELYPSVAEDSSACRVYSTASPQLYIVAVVHGWLIEEARPLAQQSEKSRCNKKYTLVESVQMVSCIGFRMYRQMTLCTRQSKRRYRDTLQLLDSNPACVLLRLERQYKHRKACGTDPQSRNSHMSWSPEFQVQASNSGMD